jgi:hypothetical protein
VKCHSVLGVPILTKANLLVLDTFQGFRFQALKYPRMPLVRASLIRLCGLFVCLSCLQNWLDTLGCALVLGALLIWHAKLVGLWGWFVACAVVEVLLGVLDYSEGFIVGTSLVAFGGWYAWVAVKNESSSIQS